MKRWRRPLLLLIIVGACAQLTFGEQHGARRARSIEPTEQMLGAADAG